MDKPCKACSWWQYSHSCEWYQLAEGKFLRLQRQPWTQSGALHCPTFSNNQACFSPVSFSVYLFLLSEALFASEKWWELRRGRLLEGSGPFIPKLFKGRIPIFLSLNSCSCKIRCWPLDQCVTVKLSSKESYSISSLTTQVVHNLHLQFFSSTLDFYFYFYF